MAKVYRFVAKEEDGTITVYGEWRSEKVWAECERDKLIAENRGIPYTYEIQESEEEAALPPPV